MRIQLAQGEIQYREVGAGKPIVFVHGALVDGALWNDVVPEISGYRCIVPDWPMGSHRTAMARDADLSPQGMARVVGDFLDALDLNDVTLVGSDTGGAVCQLLCATRPARVARVVLTNCDALDVFPPHAFAYLKTVQKIPGLPWIAGKVMRASAKQRASKRAYGGLTVKKVDDAILRAWVEPLSSSAIRRDLKKLVVGMDAALTTAAAETGWPMPTLLVWGADDPFFPLALGERLAAALPDAYLTRVDGASTFVSLDQPEALASHIVRFASGSHEWRSGRAAR
ncbi:MAG TPA: alpha/beta hydrolase [Kofleriaceae bacterium]|nr:alpha/beta hydrolase [Kofleriaceae bacterium]